MEPLINPWIFYFLELINDLDFVAGCISGLLIVALIIAAFFYIDFCLQNGGDDDEDDDAMITARKWFKRALIICLLSTLTAVALPERETMYKMMVASQITENNYNYAKDEITELIDYIAEKFKGE